jgi:hypothetical protein
MLSSRSARGEGPQQACLTAALIQPHAQPALPEHHGLLPLLLLVVMLLLLLLLLLLQASEINEKLGDALAAAGNLPGARDALQSCLEARMQLFRE